MRVVVVGGTGNISTGVVKALLQWGHEVTVFTRGRHRNLLPDGVRYLVGDRKDRAAFESAMQAERFDVAIDMICYNAEDAESAVRAFRGVKQLIYTSTVATFGGPHEKAPIDETTSCRPNAPYGINKLAADNIFMSAHARGDFPVTIFKPAYTWGPGMNIIRQLSSTDRKWLDRVRRRKAILVAAGGQAFIANSHSDDTGIAYAAAVGRTKCCGETYIVTGNVYMTFREYHERVASSLGCAVTLVDAPVDLLIKAWPDNTNQLDARGRWNRFFRTHKINRDIPEYQQRISLEEGIPACVDWMEREKRLEDSTLDETEDRIIAAIDRMYASLGLTR
jgi:nucleoside-diphosphate-sugar epimerase